MSTPATAEQLLEPNEEIWPDIPLPPTNLPLEDGIPLETNQHRMAMNALIQSLKQAWSDRTDFFVGGNMFVYFSTAQVRNKDYRGPDFFVALDIDGSYSRQSWMVWEEGGKYPDVIIELLSPSTKAEDLGTKKTLYERIFKTADYFVFDPFDAHSLQGWHLKESHYEPLIPNPQGWLWSSKLELWLGVWEGQVEQESRFWLRFYDAQGQLVLLPEEAAKQQAQEAQQQAQEAQQQAEQAQQQADSERQQRLLAEQRAEQLAQRLRALGVNPDD